MTRKVSLARELAFMLDTKDDRERILMLNLPIQIICNNINLMIIN